MSVVITTILIILFVSLMILWILMLVRAFRDGAISWIIGMFILGPIASIIYYYVSRSNKEEAQSDHQQLTPSLTIPLGHKKQLEKDSLLFWIGFLLGITPAVLQLLTPISFSSKTALTLLELVNLLSTVLVAWGCILLLKAKHRTLWWLLLVAPALFGWIIVTLIIFLLKDESGVSAPLPVGDPERNG